MSIQVKVPDEGRIKVEILGDFLMLTQVFTFAKLSIGKTKSSLIQFQLSSSSCQNGLWVGITSGKIELVRICYKKDSYQWDEKIIPLVRIFFYEFSPVGRMKFSTVGKGTSHPRIAHGQRYPMPCLEGSPKEVE